MSRHKGRRGPRRQARTTVLLVGEGDSECAFLRRLKAIYVPRNSGVAVTISNARGKGPQHVIDHSVGQISRGAYDLAAALLDNDLACSAAHLRKARRHQIHLIWSTPCFEGLLLEILGRHVPSRTQHCKTSFDAAYAIDRCRPESYVSLRPEVLLEDRRARIERLDALCRLMEGRAPTVRAPSTP